MQQKLDLLYKYCQEWCLEINVNKTKIIIFNKRGQLIKVQFTINDIDIECIKTYKYLGIILSNSGSFKVAKSHLYNKALKSSFKIYKDIKPTDPSIKTLLHLFDHIIKPIATYGSDIWGVLSASMQSKDKCLYEIFKNWETENLHMKFCKFIIGSGKKSTNFAVLSELGRQQIFYSIISAILSYCHRLENTPKNSLIYNAYKESMILDSCNINSWFSTVTYLCKKTGHNMV